MKMENVYVIQGAIKSRELLKFSEECNYYRSAIGNSDLSEFGSAIDIFENFNLSDTHSARYDPDSYFAERWRDRHSIDEDKAVLRSFLLSKLPSIIAKVYHCQKLHIFNEVYIVKEPHSQVAFRWHTDAEEQLCALPLSHRSTYYSAWCPLDNASVENGTLAFPHGTNIIKLQLDDKNCRDATLSVAKSPPENADDEMTQVLISDSLQSSCQQPSESDDGLLIQVDTGTTVLFSSTMWHRSGENRSIYPRRVLYVQYSPKVITSCSSSSRTVSKSSHTSNMTEANDEECPLSFGIPCTFDDNAIELLPNKDTNISATLSRHHSDDDIRSLQQSTPESATDFSRKRTRFT